MQNLVLVDKNSIARAWHAATVMKTDEGFQTQAVYGIVITMMRLKEKFKDRQIIVLDDGRADFRYQLYPQYKGNRKPKDAKAQAQMEAYYAQRDYINKILFALGVPKFKAPNYEADDIAGYICTNKKDREVALITSDKDWLLLISDGVEWFDLRKHAYVNKDCFYSATKVFTPEQFLMKKCLMGDRSDNINGVGGIGEMRATTLAMQYSTFENFLASFSKTPKHSTWETKLFESKEAHEIYARNQKLMDLRHKTIDLNQIQKSVSKFNEDEFFNLCSELQFNSLIAELKKIKELFK